MVWAVEVRGPDGWTLNWHRDTREPMVSFSEAQCGVYRDSLNAVTPDTYRVREYIPKPEAE